MLRALLCFVRIAQSERAKFEWWRKTVRHQHSFKHQRKMKMRMRTAVDCRFVAHALHASYKPCERQKTTDDSERRHSFTTENLQEARRRNKPKKNGKKIFSHSRVTLISSVRIYLSFSDSLTRSLPLSRPRRSGSLTLFLSRTLPLAIPTLSLTSQNCHGPAVAHTHARTSLRKCMPSSKYGERMGERVKRVAVNCV